MSDMRTFIKVEHSRFTLILRKGMLPFHWIAESHVYPDKGYVTAVLERTNYGKECRPHAGTPILCSQCKENLRRRKTKQGERKTKP